MTACERPYSGPYAAAIQMTPCDRPAGHGGFCEYRTLTDAAPAPFGALLAELRWPAGQSWLARAVNVSPAYICKLERGTRATPSRRVVSAIADALVLDDGDRERLFHAAGLVARRAS